jgi:hypothetical protein
MDPLDIECNHIPVGPTFSFGPPFTAMDDFDPSLLAYLIGSTTLETVVARHPTQAPAADEMPGSRTSPESPSASCGPPCDNASQHHIKWMTEGWVIAQMPRCVHSSAGSRLHCPSSLADWKCHSPLLVLAATILTEKVERQPSRCLLVPSDLTLEKGPGMVLDVAIFVEHEAVAESQSCRPSLVWSLPNFLMIEFIHIPRWLL